MTGGGYNKPLRLSPALSALCGGEEILSRPQVVSKVWVSRRRRLPSCRTLTASDPLQEHIKANDLQNPKDRREILCDDVMKVSRPKRILAVHLLTRSSAGCHARQGHHVLDEQGSLPHFTIQTEPELTSLSQQFFSLISSFSFLRRAPLTSLCTHRNHLSPVDDNADVKPKSKSKAKKEESDSDSE